MMINHMFHLMVRTILLLTVATFSLAFPRLLGSAAGGELTEVTQAEVQPLMVHVKRLRESLGFLGEPHARADYEQILAERDCE